MKQIQDDTVGILFKDKKEFTELMSIYDRWGWNASSGCPAMSCDWYGQYEHLYVRMHNKFCYGNALSARNVKFISMDEFKRIQHLSLVPSKGQKYYYIDFNAEIVRDAIFEDSRIDKMRIDFSNVFNSNNDALEKMNEITP
jgi:hypothetical protein